MLTALIVIIGLSFLILAHEAGHFLVAKFFKLRVDEFGFGFPPRIFAKKIGETEYSLNWLPFGGFVKIAGENDHMDTETGHTEFSDKEKQRIFFTQFAWKRSAIVLAGVAVNFVVGWWLLAAVLMVGSNPITFVADVVPGSPAALAGVRRGDVLKDYQSVQALSDFLASNADKSVNVNVIGQTKELALTVVKESSTAIYGERIVVADVQPDSPASKTGMRPGDVISGYDDANALIAFINANKGKEIEVNITRGDATLVVHPTVRMDTSNGGLGILLSEGHFWKSAGMVLREVGSPSQGFFAAMKNGFGQTLMLARITAVSFYELLRSLFVHGTLLEGVVGPIGIFSFAQQAGEIGFVHVIYLIALISVNLAVINLVPFPALDGGRFFLILIEKIKGSPISQRIEGVVNTAGFVFLIFLMVVITLRDIINL